jgi:hypothetical protein
MYVYLGISESSVIRVCKTVMPLISSALSQLIEFPSLSTQQQVSNGFFQLREGAIFLNCVEVYIIKDFNLLHNHNNHNK